MNDFACKVWLRDIKSRMMGRWMDRETARQTDAHMTAIPLGHF